MSKLIGRLVKSKIKNDDQVFLVISVADSVNGECAGLRRIHPAPLKDMGYVNVKELELYDKNDYEISDALSHLVVQSLCRKVNTTGLSMRAGATKFMPFQFRPLLSYLGNGRRRLLIADEAGLGKTISASYIMIEEMARAPLERVAIVCPSQLKSKWRGELWRRFGLRFIPMNGRCFLDALAGGDRFRCIVSMDAMRGKLDDFMARLTIYQPIDMLIVDEAHHLVGRGQDTLRREFIQALSLISDRVVGLTASPMQIDLMDLKRVLDVIDPMDWNDERFRREMDLQSVLNKIYGVLGKRDWVEGHLVELKCAIDEALSLSASLGDVLAHNKISRILGSAQAEKARGEEWQLKLRREVRDAGPLAGRVTRTTRIEVGEDRERKVINVRISLDNKALTAVQGGRETSVSEKSLFLEVDNLLKESFSHVHRRQLSSCLPAMIGLLESGMKGFHVWTNGRAYISDNERGHLGDDEINGWREYAALALDHEEIVRCRGLIDKYQLLGSDTKFDRMMRELRENVKARKVIVFTQWRHTIKYLRRRASGIWDIKCFVVSGEDSEEEREGTMSMFQGHEGFAILFAADVLSEGLDLQSADCVVNYDLPYNPLRVEQRIGRVDRIGQESGHITIINLLVEGSTDEEIYNKLLSRIGVFESYIGDMPPTIRPTEFTEPLINREEISREIGRLEDIKRLQQHPALQGLDDALDKDTREIYYAKTRDLSELRALVIRDFFRLILGKEASIRVIDHHVVEIEGITKEDAEVVAQLVASMVAMDAADEVRNRIQLSAEAGGNLSISSKPDSGGWYIPLMHPIMATAVKLLQIYNDQGPNTQYTEIIETITPINGMVYPGQNLIITEHRFESPLNIETHWKWWAVKNGEKVFAFEDLDTWKFAENAKDWRFMTVPHDKGLSMLPGQARRTVQEEHERWAMEQSRRIRGQLLTAMEIDMERIKIMKWKMEKSIGAEGITGSITSDEMKIINEKYQKICEQKIKIQNNEDGCVSKGSSWRLVAIIAAGEPSG